MPPVEPVPFGPLGPRDEPVSFLPEHEKASAIGTIASRPIHSFLDTVDEAMGRS